MEFQNPVIGGGDEIVREAIQSRGYTPGFSGWRLERNGNAFFVNGTFIGDVTITGAARSANYVPATSGWELRANGSAEFNGNVDMLSAQITGTIQSANYVAGVSGWQLDSTGRAEFNGNLLTALADGKIHVGANADTSVSVLNGTATVTNANPQNTPQIQDHGYQAFVQVGVNSVLAGARIRYKIWDGAPGGTQLGVMAPIVKVQQINAGTFETFLMSFVWRAPATATIANINLEMEFLQGTGGNAVTTRVDTGSYMFIITDLGDASRITNL
jgi:hypothetical protein